VIKFITVRMKEEKRLAKVKASRDTKGSGSAQADAQRRSSRRLRRPEDPPAAAAETEEEKEASRCAPAEHVAFRRAARTAAQGLILR